MRERGKSSTVLNGAGTVSQALSDAVPRRWPAVVFVSRDLNLKPLPEALEQEYQAERQTDAKDCYGQPLAVGKSVSAGQGNPAHRSTQIVSNSGT